MDMIIYTCSNRITDTGLHTGVHACEQGQFAHTVPTFFGLPYVPLRKGAAHCAW